MRTLVASTFAAATLIGAFGIFGGRWLVVNDELRPADAIVVIGGRAPFRAMEAARLFNAGLAPAVLLTHGTPTDEDLALRELGIERPADDDYSEQVLAKLGVPHPAIHRMPSAVVNTADEVRAVAAFLGPSANRVILVTSGFHTRRVRLLWNQLEQPVPTAIVRSVPEEPTRPEHWWRSTQDAEFVMHEWFGIVNVWLGEPLASRP